MTINLRTFLISIGFLLFAVYLTDQFISVKNTPTKPPAAGTRIAAGVNSGVYYNFTKKYSNFENGFASIIETNGSVENLNMLLQGDVEFAIIQSDTMYFAYNGLKNFSEEKSLRLVTSLFEEKIRLYVPKDGSITSLRDLNHKNICVGSVDSGGYLNSIAVLNGIGLTAELDFTPIYADAEDCLKQAESQPISALFQTSHLPLNKNNTFKEKVLPLSVIDKVIDSQPYFRRMIDGNNYHLTVDAYLVTIDTTSKSEVGRVVYSLAKNWPQLKKEIPSLPGKINVIHGKNIPNHNGAIDVLKRGSGARSGLFLSPLVLSFWIILLLLCLYAERQKATYNRLGESTLGAWAEKIIVNFIGKFSQFLIAFFAIVAAVFLLKSAEEAHARSEGIQSQFLDLNFVDSLMWLFSYISSGFTSDGIYPVSTMGQFIAAMLSLAGILAPITAVIYLLNAANKKSRQKFLGFGSTSFKHHVLLCGWNEKAPGIIYTLTGQDVDERKKVAVVGNMAENNPFESYRFDSKYVSYIRGAPSDIAALNRANASEASAAVILADLATSEEKNADSVLTAMHVRRANPDIHICSELEYQENADLFKACGSDVVIDAHNIITRLAIMAISSPKIIDYVLDTISYHDFDELYSTKVSEEESLTGFVGRPLRALETELLHNGVNLVGLLEEEKETSTMTRDEFSSMSNLTALVDHSDSRKILSANSVIIFASKDRKRIKPSNAAKQLLKPHRLLTQSFP